MKHVRINYATVKAQLTQLNSNCCKDSNHGSNIYLEQITKCAKRSSKTMKYDENFLQMKIEQFII